MAEQNGFFCPSARCILLKQVPGNDHLLNLRGSLKDGEYAAVAVYALNLIFPDESVAATPAYLPSTVTNMPRVMLLAGEKSVVEVPLKIPRCVTKST